MRKSQAANDEVLFWVMGTVGYSEISVRIPSLHYTHDACGCSVTCLTRCSITIHHFLQTRTANNRVNCNIYLYGIIKYMTDATDLLEIVLTTAFASGSFAGVLKLFTITFY